MNHEYHSRLTDVCSGHPLTCDHAADNQRKNDHLQHPKEHVTRKREVLDVQVGQVGLAHADAKRDAQDHSSGSRHQEQIRLHELDAAVCHFEPRFDSKKRN